MLLIIGVLVLIVKFLVDMMSKIPFIGYIPVIGGLVTKIALLWWLYPLAFFLVIYDVTRKLSLSLLSLMVIVLLMFLGGMV